MALKSIITVFEPTIELDQMDMDDSYFQPAGGQSRPDDIQSYRATGDESPLVMINGFKFIGKDIKSCMISLEDILPRIQVQVTEKGGVFISKFYPKDGDVVSFYSRMKGFKHIRCDFIILKINSSPSSDSQGEINTYLIEGILKIPGYWNEYSESYDSTSYEIIKKISKKLKLGFATNEVSTNDKMKHLCEYETYSKFLNGVLSTSYKSDSEFYNYFVDWYYMLNFVEMNSRFMLKSDIFEPSMEHILQTDVLAKKDQIEFAKMPFYLTNSTIYQHTPNFISGYTLLNNCGSISLTNAYRRYIQYYDKNQKKFTEYFIETLTTEGSGDKIILKGRSDEDHTKFVKYKFMGSQNDDNVHKNYHHAKVQNYINMKEISKLMLYVDLRYVNPNLRKGDTVPVFIINKGNQVRTSMTSDVDTDSLSGTQDKFLSGFYVVKSIFLIYDGNSNKYHHKAILCRREWDSPI